MRAGMSLSMNYVILIVIGVAVAGLVVMGFTTHFGTFEEIVGGGIDESDRSLARESCIRQHGQLCSLDDVSGTDWATQATYKGRTCEEWINSYDVLPAVNDCGDSYR